ncbi:unnamed protein product [Caenorhabditis auriculariae]|uniref:Uncharacterized protein n=1 Tax=Caenorhabditis auriculariae TaxID=2777116 RepID=A0A8S1GT67_9PELO|nr:unnamed protein product [Caenorhabditis auriculariae]
MKVLVEGQKGMAEIDPVSWGQIAADDKAPSQPIAYQFSQGSDAFLGLWGGAAGEEGGARGGTRSVCVRGSWHEFNSTASEHSESSFIALFTPSFLIIY